VRWRTPAPASAGELLVVARTGVIPAGPVAILAWSGAVLHALLDPLHALFAPIVTTR
jgi:hypothetical protein